MTTRDDDEITSAMATAAIKMIAGWRSVAEAVVDDLAVEKARVKRLERECDALQMSADVCARERDDAIQERDEARAKLASYEQAPSLEDWARERERRCVENDIAQLKAEEAVDPNLRAYLVSFTATGTGQIHVMATSPEDARTRARDDLGDSAQLDEWEYNEFFEGELVED